MRQAFKNGHFEPRSSKTCRAVNKDGNILDSARKEAKLLLEEDEGLEKAENINFARAYRPYAKERLGWSRIS